jgi:hypothetical protein
VRLGALGAEQLNAWRTVEWRHINFGRAAILVEPTEFRGLKSEESAAEVQIGAYLAFLLALGAGLRKAEIDGSRPEAILWRARGRSGRPTIISALSEHCSLASGFLGSKASCWRSTNGRLRAI